MHWGDPNADTRTDGDPKRNSDSNASDDTDTDTDTNTNTNADTNADTDQYIWHYLLLLKSSPGPSARCYARPNW